MDYVVGFAFTHDDHVALIRKKRPEWQKGLLNGVGGKIEKGEMAHEAMVREFKEETGIDTTLGQWVWFEELEDGRGELVSFFYTDITWGDLATEHDHDEPLVICRADKLPEDIMPNLKWLVPSALQRLRTYEKQYGGEGYRRRN